MKAMRILKNPDASDIIQEIEACEDVDALRIIAFTASVSAWPMEAGPNAEFDMQLDGIFFIAMRKLFSLDSEEADASIECYKRAFPPDGAYSLFLKECEEERSKRKGIQRHEQEQNAF